MVDLEAWVQDGVELKRADDCVGETKSSADGRCVALTDNKRMKMERKDVWA